MITLDMTKKHIDVAINEQSFVLESGVLTLQISLGTYSLAGKTITAAFSLTELETGALAVTDGVIQLPIYYGLLAFGTNYIQLNIRTGTTLEQSPRMVLFVRNGVTTTPPSAEDATLVTYLVNLCVTATAAADAVVADYESLLGEGHQLQSDLQQSITDGNTINNTLTNTTIPAATAIEQTLRETTTPAAQSIDSTLTDETIPAAQAIYSDLADPVTGATKLAGDAEASLEEAIALAGETKAQLVSTGDTQTARVTGEGDEQEARVTGEGTTQVGLVQAAGASLQETIEGADAINDTLTDTTIPNAQSINTTLTDTTIPNATSINDTLTNTTIPNANEINTTLTDTTIPAAQQAKESLQEVIDNSQIGSLDELKTSAKLTLVDAINENSLAFSRIAAPKYGVSGVGGSSLTLTKLWDLVDKSVAVGTDLAGATNDLDTLAPFNRRKCVGSWISGGNEAIFVPQAYYGDPDYAEDGSKGDYVAVDIEPFWWYESSDGSTIGVSPGPQYGWEIHPICVNKRTGIVRDHTYIPAFALALKDGKAVSLPGYRNERGTYKSLWDSAKTYDGTAKQYAILEPSEIDHYEWLLQTIEFATTNPQTVMRGAVDMRYADDPITALTPTTGVVSATAGAAFVAGQNVYIGTSYSADTQASHKIDTIVPSDVSGNPAGSGYYLLTMTPYAGATDITTITTPKIATRPWSTGACNGVLSPSGSPVSNASGKYPARYRWRENPYGNQNMTCVDLMNRLTGGNLEWYYLSNPLAYYPSDVNKPDEAVLIGAGSAWAKLAVTPENYADGYIKKRGSDPALKHIKVPTLTAGASDTTYFSDYAYLVNSPLVRSVRRRGYTIRGSSAGPCFVTANNAPGTSLWFFGGALFMVQ